MEYPEPEHDKGPKVLALGCGLTVLMLVLFTLAGFYFFS